MKNWDDTMQEKISSYSYNQEVTEEKMNSFFDRMDEERNRKGLFNEKSAVLLKIAASMALIIIAGFASIKLADQKHSTALGESQSIILPDGSNVQLNAGSELVYNRLTWYFERSLELEGEGFFEVEKGSAFTVASKWGKTEVLGTSFNIYARKETYRVHCYTGKVQVTTQNNTALLTKGQGVRFGYELESKDFSFDTASKDWRHGTFLFDNENLSHVFDELAIQYDIEIKMPETLDSMKYSGYFPASDLKMALKLTCDPLDLTYKVKQNKVLIESKNTSI